MSRYIKAMLAALGAVGTWGITAGADEGYTDVEFYGLLLAMVTALSVYAFPNKPPVGERPDPSLSEQMIYRPDPNNGPGSDGPASLEEVDDH